MKLQATFFVKIIFFVYIVFKLQSCVVYSPQTPLIPLMKDTNELQIEGGISLVTAINASIAYSPIPHYAFQIFGNLQPDNFYYTQGAVGRFWTLNENKVVELYGGFGNGNFNEGNEPFSRSLKGNYYIPYLQCNFGKRNTKFLNMDYGISFKTGIIYSKSVERIYKYSNSSNSVSYNDRKDYGLLFEPEFFIRYGLKHIKFDFKYSDAWIQEFSKSKGYISCNFIGNLGVGLHYCFN